jgi:uncharacterized DUF497 family protein
MELEWDRAKAASNLAKHGVSFQEAVEAFLDPHRVVARDLRHSTSREARWFCFGTVQGRVLTVGFTIRDDRIRFFGAGAWREGRRRNEQAHEQGL